jgi:hypothetical protein
MLVVILMPLLSPHLRAEGFCAPHRRVLTSAG